MKEVSKRGVITALLFSVFLVAGVSCGGGGEAKKPATNDVKKVEVDPFAGLKKTKRKLYVYARAGLNMRSDSSVNGKKVGQAPFGAKVRVIETPGTKVTYKSEGIKGYWIIIEYDGKRGYVFDGYLGTLPTPKKGIGSFMRYFDKQFKILKAVTNSTYESDGVLKVVHTLSRGVRFNLNEEDDGSQVEYSLPGINITELFILARLCQPDYFPKNLKFPSKEGVNTLDRGAIGTVEIQFQNTDAGYKTISSTMEQSTISLEETKNGCKISIAAS